MAFKGRTSLFLTLWLTASAAAPNPGSGPFTDVTFIVNPPAVGVTPGTYQVDIVPSCELVAQDVIQMTVVDPVFKSNTQGLFTVDYQGTKMCEGSQFATLSGGLNAVFILQGSPCALSKGFSLTVDPSALLPNPGPGKVLAMVWSSKNQVPFYASYATEIFPSPSPSPNTQPFVDFAVTISPLTTGVTPYIYSVSITPSYDLRAGDVIMLTATSPVFQDNVRAGTFVDFQGTPVCETSLFVTINGGMNAILSLQGSSCDLSGRFNFNIESTSLKPNPAPGVVFIEGSSSRNPYPLRTQYTTVAGKNPNPQPPIPGSFADFDIAVGPLTVGVTPYVYSVTILPSVELVANTVIELTCYLPVFKDKAQVTVFIDYQGSPMCDRSVLISSRGGTDATLLLQGSPCKLSGRFHFNIESTFLEPNPGPGSITLQAFSSKNPVAVRTHYTTVDQAHPAPLLTRHRRMQDSELDADAPTAVSEDSARVSSQLYMPLLLAPAVLLLAMVGVHGRRQTATQPAAIDVLEVPLGVAPNSPACGVTPATVGCLDCPPAPTGPASV